jgi:spermidine synthase
MDLETLRLITRTFLEVFPDAEAHLAHFSLDAPIVGLVARVDGNETGLVWLKGLAKLVADDELRAKLLALRIESPLDVLGGHVASAEGLRVFAGEGPLNTDDRPRVLYHAPRFAYGRQDGAGSRLVQLVEATASRTYAPGQRLAPALQPRLRAYLEARDAFLRAGLKVDRDADLLTLVGDAREGLLEAVRLSADFGAAYEPLLTMARRLHKIDPAGALSLLDDLQKANPKRREAGKLREALAGSSS